MADLKAAEHKLVQQIIRPVMFKANVQPLKIRTAVETRMSEVLGGVAPAVDYTSSEITKGLTRLFDRIRPLS